MGVSKGRDNGELVRLRNVTKSYPMGEKRFQALRSIDLTIQSGEHVAIMGPSGSGKSTLLNILGCLDIPSSGEYLLGGRDVSRLSERQLARVRNSEIGFVFQSFNLLPRATALANVELPLVYRGVQSTERRERAAEALAAVHLSGRANHHPSELSGGECQRVAIARAIVTQPRLLLADEPTGNLDSASSRAILDLLTDLHRQGNTLVVVTHEHEVADEAERLIQIRDGEVAGDQRGARDRED